jgi:hypothetical protein
MDEMELVLRESFFPYWILYALLISVAIISGVKLMRPAVFQHISSTYVKPPSTVPNSKENLSFLGRASWMLLLNYFIVSSITVFMVLMYYDIQHYWLVLLPTAYYFFQVFALFFSGMISRETKRLSENFLLLNFIYQNMGLVLIPVLIMWLLNVNYSLYFINAIQILFVAFLLFRYIRGFFFAIQNKVLWYYIILYLCTLEIWPLMVLFRLLTADLEG